MGKATMTILAGVIVGVSTFAGATFNTNSKVVTDNSLLADKQSTAEYSDFSNIKFEDTKLVDENGTKLLSTTIQNNSNEKIVNVKYIYDVDNDIISLEKANEIMPGATSEATIKVSNNAAQNNIKLIKAYVTIEDHNNQLTTVEYVQNI